MIRFNLNIFVILWSANISKMNINSVLFQTAAIGDYLFLIMIVLASIIQAIIQNNKKKVIQEQEQRKILQNRGQASEVMGYNPERMSGYEPIADNIFDPVDRIFNPEPEDDEHYWGDDYLVTEPEEKKPEVTVESSIGSADKLTREVMEKQATPAAQKPVKNISAPGYKSGIRNGFSLRKAVIYSEILNRKYT